MHDLAPEWDVSAWLNSDRPLSLAAFRGRPIVAAAFQMLCPGCVAHTIPQLNQVRQYFPEDRLAVLGLHSVFEHHQAMQEPSLRAFLHEYQVTFPIAIDRPSQDGPLPHTMVRYAFRGTPTLMLIDAQGRLRRKVFGHVPDLQLGAEIAELMAEAGGRTTPPPPQYSNEGEGTVCAVGDGSC